MRRQACVIGGWTDPRGSRPFFGALLLGVYDDDGRLQYIGHSGAGFTDAELGRVWKRLQRAEDEDLAVRHDAADQRAAALGAAEARRRSEVHGMDGRRQAAASDLPRAARRHQARERAQGAGYRGPRRRPSAAQPAAAPRAAELAPIDGRQSAAAERRRSATTKQASRSCSISSTHIQEQGGNGVLHLARRAIASKSATSERPFWPKLKLTKGDLFRHYVRVAPVILPVLADRPLVMKRYPNGVAAKPFYQHRAPDKIPAGVRVEHGRDRDRDARPHLIGGDR